MWRKSIADIAFLFGPFEFIPSRPLLSRAGRPIKLGGRACDILRLLLTRAGEQVGKRDLLEFAWPGNFVDERNLKVHVRSIRRALDDSFPQASYIATVVGRGYRFIAPVEVVQVGPPDPTAKASVLPEAENLIGRQNDVETIMRGLDTSKLVTLVGPGGVGKTSLSITVARTQQERFPDGIHFVDLSTSTDHGLVPQLVATGLGLRLHTADPIAAISDYLREKRALVLLDNCEHLLLSVGALADRLVRANVVARLLVTSREPLGVGGEMLHRVEPLAVPGPGEVRSAAEALNFPSIRLFARRATQCAGFELSDRDVQAVAGLCAAVDGLPLAIEIVAAKLAEFTPAALLASVGQHFGSLRYEHATPQSRHRTLRATLDWSYQLLSVEEAALFRLLSVFAGPFEWDDITAIVRVIDYDSYQLTRAAGGLVAKSLLSTDGRHGPNCYRFLESTRAFAAEHLLEDPMSPEARKQHAELVLAMLMRSEREWSWSESRTWRARYAPRVGDVRKALDHCFTGGGDASLGLDLAIAAIRLWNEQSFISEQLLQAERALDCGASIAGAPDRMAILATARAWSVTLARRRQLEADEAWTLALRLAERSDNGLHRLSAMFGMAVFFIYNGRNRRAVHLMRDLRQAAARTGDQASVIDGERLQALAEMHLGKLVDVRTALERLAKDLDRGMLPSRIARYQEERYVSIHSTLAFSTWLTGGTAHALAMVEEMVLKMDRIGQLMGQSNILALVAMPLALWSGHLRDLERYVAIMNRNLGRENLVIWEPVHRFYVSFVRHAHGDGKALLEMRLAVDELVADGRLLRTPMYLGIVAELLLEAGDPAAADEAAKAALTLLARSEESWCQPELLRLEASAAVALGKRTVGHAKLVDARRVARAHGARNFEHRIVNDLAQLAIAEGRKAEAIELLAPWLRRSDAAETSDQTRTASLLLLVRTG